MKRKTTRIYADREIIVNIEDEGIRSVDIPIGILENGIEKWKKEGADKIDIWIDVNTYSQGDLIQFEKLTISAFKEEVETDEAYNLRIAKEAEQETKRKNLREQSVREEELKLLEELKRKYES